MATKKTVGKRKTKNQFPKGKSGNPFGRVKMSDEEKELSLKNRTQFKLILQKYMITTKEELKKIYKAKNTPALDGMIIKSILNSLDSGDGIDWFLNHIAGKPKETTNINLTGSMENTNTMSLKDLSDEELLVIKKASEKSDA